MRCVWFVLVVSVVAVSLPCLRARAVVFVVVVVGGVGLRACAVVVVFLCFACGAPVARGPAFRRGVSVFTTEGWVKKKKSVATLLSICIFIGNR